jgi:hypothetical protein
MHGKCLSLAVQFDVFGVLKSKLRIQMRCINTDSQGKYFTQCSIFVKVTVYFAYGCKLGLVTFVICGGAASSIEI